MPYNCEDCKKSGAKMNILFEIRLCKTCSHSLKYKSICKSNVLLQYKLSKEDFYDYPYKIFYCNNPYWKNGPPMTLYLELDIRQLFLNKYSNIITNILQIYNPIENFDNTFQLVSKYINQYKTNLKQKKFKKILDSYNIEFYELPELVHIELTGSKNTSQCESIVLNFLRFKKLNKIP